MKYSLLIGAVALAAFPLSLAKAADEFVEKAKPLLDKYCTDCHSTEKHKGDLDLQQFATEMLAGRKPDVWEHSIQQLADGEMPPKKSPQPTAEEKQALSHALAAMLERLALAQAGDPGPVILRRLSNAEYTYTIRDLTGVTSLDPAKDFPVDGATGEGFTNVGAGLVMSPALLTKYLDAAKSIASHAILLPDGIDFSRATSTRDWTDEKLAAIRAFYARFTQTGGGASVNLQGIKFDTNDGGVLPLEKYFATTLKHREDLKGGKNLSQVAAEEGLNAKFLSTLWTALTSQESTPLLGPIKNQWATSSQPADELAKGLTQAVREWQRALWQFTTVGHIGKRDGPKAWQVPVSPLAEARELRYKLPAPDANGTVTFYLATSDAGDGSLHDVALWQDIRLVAPGRPALPLREVKEALERIEEAQAKIFAGAAKSLAATSEVSGRVEPSALQALAQKHQLEPMVLAAWMDAMGIGAGEAKIESPLTQKIEKAENHDFIKGWGGADALSVIANSSDQQVRIPGVMKPHSVAMHPAPQRRAIVGWRSPIAGTLKIEGHIQHVHPECGNGVGMVLELRHGATRHRLAAGETNGSTVIIGPLQGIAVQPGDLLSLSVRPRDGNHSCDLTNVELTIQSESLRWNLAEDISPNILAGNPHADQHGNAEVWHFYSEPEKAGTQAPVMPPGSLLAKWMLSPKAEEKAKLAEELQHLLNNGPGQLPADSPDAVLYRQLSALQGPLLSSVLKSGAPKRDGTVITSPWGLDPALFGSAPDHTAVGPNDLCFAAPSVIEVKLPARLAHDCELVATTSLHATLGAEGSVQFSVTPTKPSTTQALAAGTVKEQGGKSTWSDGVLPAVSDSPIIVAKSSQTRQRLEAALDHFRQLFPAALCYTKIVPVDEVVTLTLFYREDEAFKRLLLNEEEAAQLDRLWEELHFISQDALTLVDAYEQLWQFATQDADPSAFTPMGEPIKRRAAEFREKLQQAEPRHVESVIAWAENAWRRPLSDKERTELRQLYQAIRNQEVPHDTAIRQVLARVLVAPSFLYRLENTPEGSSPAEVNAWELASRLSYFLWSSVPDEELRASAASGKLKTPEELVRQLHRMRQSPKIERLATEFGCQWLHVRDLATLDEKSERHFPTFTSVRSSLQEEAARFFTDFFQRNAAVQSLVNADYSFVNKELATHYGLKFDHAEGWHRIDGMRAAGRGGILGMASVLAKQSGASRTSPVLRGNWLIETVLGERSPKPPSGVPILPQELPEGLTERQITEKHVTHPDCARCHERIDPFGYALENFDAIGRFRQVDAAGLKVDSSATLRDGRTLQGLEGLREYVLNVRGLDFRRQVYRKLLGYSLGRSVQLSDSPLLDRLAHHPAANDLPIGTVLEEIVTSPQFRSIRGKEMISSR